MTGLDSAWLILLAEALLVVMTLALISGWLWHRRRSNEQSEIQQFIDRLDDATPSGNKALSDWLNRCGLDQARIDALLAEVNTSERALYQRIVELLLKRDMTVLQALEQSISQLPEPYLRAIENLSQEHKPGTSSSMTSVGPLAALEHVNEQLRHQLDTALQTIDDITAEYTRVFAGQQTALELENSRKHMLKIFQQTEQQLRQDTPSNKEDS